MSNNKDSWSRKIAADHHEDIPILTKIPKGVDQHHFSFNGFAKDHNLAQAIAYHVKRFGSPAEIERAALHIGVHIIYHMVNSDEGSIHEKAARIMKTFSSMEPIYYKQEIMDEIIFNVKHTHDCMRSGLISDREFAEKVSEVQENARITFDDSFCELLKAKISDIINGKSPTELTTCRTHGGVRNLYD